MYFEDEKDIINENSNLRIEDDGTVAWEDILSESDENAVEFINDDSSDSAGGGDALVSSADSSNVAYDTASDSDSVSIRDSSTSQESFADDFDIDKQLQEVSLDGNESLDSDFEMPSKAPKKNGSTTILLAIFVALVAMCGAYYYFTTMQGSKQPNQETPQVQNETAPANTNETTAQESEPSESVEDTVADAGDNTAVAEDSEIQVVNDENLNVIKPPVPEKKQVIAVVPTGRVNPFLPLQKYMKVDIKNETVFLYDKAGIPAPPLGVEKQDEEVVKMLTISVSGIMYDKVKPSAIITLDENDYFVQKGDKLDDYRVVDIGTNYVTVAHGNNLYKASVGEEFKISSNFYGKAGFVPSNQGGGRQYYSISGDGAEAKKPAKSERLKNIKDAPEDNDMPSVEVKVPKDNVYVPDEDVVIKSK